MPAVETAPCEPLSPYGTAKLAAEEYIRSYNRLYGTGHVALRYGNVYGPRQDPHGEAGVVAIFLGALARGEQAYVFGDGLQARDYVYVGDVAHATTAALGQEGGVFNVGTGRDTRSSTCTRSARKSRAPTREPSTPARLGELFRSVLDPELAAHELGFRAMVELEDGLQATWDWVQGRGRTNPGAGETSARGSSASRPRGAHPSLADGGVRRRGIAVVELLLLLVIGGGAPWVRSPIGWSSPRRSARSHLRPRRDPRLARRPPSPAAKLPRSRTVIMVLNGNGRTGAALRRRLAYGRAATGSARSETHHARSRGASSCTSPASRAKGFGSQRISGSSTPAPSTACLRELGRAQVVYILGA